MPSSVRDIYIYSIIYHCTLLPLRGEGEKRRVKRMNGFRKSGCEEKVASQRGRIKEIQLAEGTGEGTQSSSENGDNLGREKA